MWRNSPRKNLEVGKPEKKKVRLEEMCADLPERPTGKSNKPGIQVVATHSEKFFSLIIKIAYINKTGQKRSSHASKWGALRTLIALY